MRKGLAWWLAGTAALFGTACQIQTSPPPEPEKESSDRVVVVQGRARESNEQSEQAALEAEQAREQAEEALTQSEQAREEAQDAQAQLREAQARAQQEAARHFQFLNEEGLGTGNHCAHNAAKDPNGRW